MTTTPRLSSTHTKMTIHAPERDLAVGRLDRVGAVADIAAHVKREVAADRAGGGLGGLCNGDGGGGGAGQWTDWGLA